MNRLLQVCFCCMVIGWASSLDALSVTKDAPYEFIPGRNVFRLQPPPAPVPTVLPVQPASPKVMPKVIVTGLTDVCGRRQVLAEISEPGRPTIKPVLAEGEEAGLVQVLHIDVGRGVVNVRIHGEASTLALPSPSVSAALPPARR
jgi:hypothetical protein